MCKERVGFSTNNFNMNEIIEQPTTADHPEMAALWEASVRATHHFLSEEDIDRIKPLLPGIFDTINVFIIRGANAIAGMMGLTRDEIAMLFLLPIKPIL
jgi:putative acetyltransferase